jgi:hypothetical protein
MWVCSPCLFLFRASEVGLVVLVVRISEERAGKERAGWSTPARLDRLVVARVEPGEKARGGALLRRGVPDRRHALS